MDKLILSMLLLFFAIPMIYALGMDNPDTYILAISILFAGWIAGRKE